MDRRTARGYCIVLLGLVVGQKAIVYQSLEVALFAAYIVVYGFALIGVHS